MNEDRLYMCIDLKSFYASVECVERGLDPLTTNLVVADPERTEKTICLAISPSMKALGIKNRCRVFEIPGDIHYLMAPPRMQLYIDYSAEIYGIYLKYIAKEDIHVYSIDEAFLDVTNYLHMYQMGAKELGQTIMDDILSSTGITATCGIGTNLYLAKIALDITAKHCDDHIGYLTEAGFRQHLWDHRPLTDFWRIGAGTARRLSSLGIRTMRELARFDEDTLYRIFGIDAELLIDHAWGRESTTMSDIKNYKPQNTSMGSGQVLSRDYAFDEGVLIVREMADLLTLDLVDKHLVTDSVTLHVGYSNIYGKKAAHGTSSLVTATSSSRRLMDTTEELYRQIVDSAVPIRRITLTYNRVKDDCYQQYDLFCDPAEMEKERRMQNAMLDIKRKFGKNAIVRGMNLQEGATTLERNRQIGGHKSGE